MNVLFETQQAILNQFKSQPFYAREIFNQITLDNYVTGIVGGRGVGKTTLLLNLVLSRGAYDGRALYVSVDHIYFLEKNLLDLVGQLYKETEVRLICIDEIHKHLNWQQLLKNIADIYPSFKVVFTSSSRIDLVRSQYDLSRRVTLYDLHGLSFREYLDFFHGVTLPKLSISELLDSTQDMKISQAIPDILRLFKQYLMRGYFPFSKIFSNDIEFYQAIQHAVQKTIYEDIATIWSLKTQTLLSLEKLYRYVLSITPGELNANKLANALGKDFSDVSEYLKMLEQAGLIRFLFSAKQGKAGLRNPIKMFPENPNFIYANLLGSSDADAMGMIRETFALSHLQNAKLQVTYDQQGDFNLGDYVLEIGGKNKTASQISELENGKVLKDGILTGIGKIKPLYLLGFLY
jgi:predicted AAA+ superfamily ATPase